MKKFPLTNYFLVLLTSLFSLIMVHVYSHQISILKTTTEKEDPRRYNKLYDLLLTPMKTLFIILFIYDILISSIFFLTNSDKVRAGLKLNKNKIAVQSKSQGGYGGFLIELMLSVFIKILSLSALIYFTLESKDQIEKILFLYSNELSEKEKLNLNKNKILVVILLIAEVVSVLLYVITFTMKFLNVRRQNSKIAFPEIRRNNNYNVLNTNHTTSSDK